MLVLAAPLTAQVSAPAFVNIGPGANQTYWTNSAQFQANWGASNFGSSPLNSYSYGINQNAATPSNLIMANTQVFVPSPPTSVTIPVQPTLLSGQTYYFWVTANAAAGGAASARSSPFVVDFAPPVPTISAPSISTKATFTVSWSSTSTVPIDRYDVAYRINGGPLRLWLSKTNLTSASFTGSNGSTYTFQVTATDAAGLIGTASTSPVAINILGATLVLTASPSSLSFSGSDTLLSLSVDVAAKGGSVNVTDIRESRTYSSWPQEDGGWESLPMSLGSGTDQTTARSVLLSVLQRSKALNGGSSGSFDLILTVRGKDASANDVQGSVTVPVSVASAPPSTLTVTAVSVELPASPYNLGDTVKNARVHITATGSGTVIGQVLVDGSTSWSGAPAFSVSISGNSVFDVLGNIPTSGAGSHTVRVEITSPVSMHSDTPYTVSSTPPAFPPSSLDLIKGVAQLTGLTGAASAASGSGYTDFTFTGSAKLVLPSLGSVSLPGFTVTGLVVRMYDNLSPPLIKGGTAVIDGGSASLTDFAGGYLKIKKIAFDFGKAADHLSVDASVVVPYVAQELFTAKDMILDASGISDITLSLDMGHALSFTLFGMTFSIHDVNGGGSDENKAIAFGKAKGGYYIGISGAISMQTKQGVNTSSKDLASFRNVDLRFYTDGSLDGNIKLISPYDLIPKDLSLDALNIAEVAKSLSLTLSGKLTNLPAPLDKSGDLPVSFTIDAKGDGSLSAPVINKLKPGGKGHALLGKSDPTEWDLGLATLNLTWLSLDLSFTGGVLDLDHSQVSLAADLYLKLTDKGGGTPSDDDKRISFGDLDGGGKLQGGIVIDLSGKVTWSVPGHIEVLKDKQLAFGPVELGFDKVSIDPSPFALVITGFIAVDMDGISGGINFDNLKIGLDGTISDIAAAVSAGGGGKLSVLDAVSIEVDSVAWSSSPSTLTLNQNVSTGSGENLTPNKSSSTINVDSYFSMKGASVTLGSGSDSIMSGGFDELTVYTLAAKDGGGTGFVVRNARLSVSDVLDITADMEYSPSPLSFLFAGSLSLPSISVTAEAVGKVGTLNGKPSFGLFVIAELGDTGIPVGPGVFLTELGGGFFVNPADDDIALVRKIAKFKRPELGDQITARRPGGASNSQSFALMVLAGFSVAEKDLVSGRALMTITSSYFNLDAEVSLLDGIADGKVYLAVSWSPAYAEGKITAEMGFPSQDDALVSGTGDMDFYFYPGVWGIDGNMQVKVLGINIAQGEMFVGTPGFMVQATVGASIDLGIVSGSVSMGGMFWYYEPNSTLGAYAQVDLKGSFLAGLFSAEAGLEGALIVSPSFLLYSVGSLSVDVLGVTVFDGSLWFAVSGSGLDGGTGRNSQYDELIAQAKDMAHALSAAKVALASSLEDAKLQLSKLTDEQAALAGVVLTEQQTGVTVDNVNNVAVDVAFDQKESSHWGGSIPEPFATIHGVLFGPQAKALVQARVSLLKTKAELDSLLTDLESLRKDVSKRLNDYQDILVETLPSVQDVGKLGNPFQGMLQKTVTVGSRTKTVKSGFVLDSGAADTQKKTLSTARESFAQYQEAFIEAAGGIDARLQKLDEILFQGDANLTALNQRFAAIHSELSRYTDDFVQFQAQSIANATTGQQTLAGLEDDVNNALAAKAKTTGDPQLLTWNHDRWNIINGLMVAGGAGAYKADPDTTPRAEFFKSNGYELWFHTPYLGFGASIASSQKHMPELIQSFSKSSATLLKNWGDSTDLTGQVFQRKADLYGILYEIYDQLAVYGSGNIGVASDGNAAGFKGLASQGLAFRASALSKSVSSKSSPMPKGMSAPSAPTFGPNRSLMKGPPSSPGFKMPEADDVPRPTVALAPIPMELSMLPGIGAGFSLHSASVPLTEAPKGMPSVGIMDRSLGSSAALAIMVPTAWVSVTTYFTGKRAEIAPYLVIPQVTSVSGSASSSSELEALLHASFNASHPIGVVEYEYRIAPISTDSGTGADSLYKSFFHAGAQSPLPKGFSNPSFVKKAPVSVPSFSSSLYKSAPSVKLGGQVASVSQVLNQGKGGAGGASIIMSAALKAIILSTTPWLSVGANHDINFLFIPQIQDPGTYALFIKVRGAGGKTIIRQGRFKVTYATPGQKVPVSSGMDTSDNTPPTTPVVTLSGAATADKEMLYAKWSSDDPYSGIQGYQYAVEEYTDLTAKEGTGAVQAAPQGGGKLVSKVLSSSAGTSTTAQFFQSGSFVSAQEASSHKWVDAQGRTEANIRGLALEQGKHYVVWVMATNGVGRASIGRSDPIVVDALPPSAPAVTAFQQVSADGHANSVSFTFTPGSDAVSGISGHSFAVGLTDKDQKVWPWTVAQGMSATIVNLPLSKGQQVTLQVKAASGAGLETTTTKTLTMTYAGGKPPVPPTVVTDPQNFTSDTAKLSITWSPASDADSGIVAYEYAVGTAPSKSDVLGWTSAAGSSSAYVLGQGPQGGKASTSMKVAAAPSLNDKGTYYALVRATNGSGLTSIGASSAVVVDVTPPDVTLTAKPESPGTDRIAVDVNAKDPVSGVARYRAKVWQMKGPVSEREELSAIAVPVMGWASSGTFQGSMQSKGIQLANPPLGQAWYTTNWQPITNAAPPTAVDIQVIVTGFPSPGMEVGKYYRVTVEVASGSGISAESNAAVIKVVAAASSYRFAPRFRK